MSCLPVEPGLFDWAFWHSRLFLHCQLHLSTTMCSAQFPKYSVPCSFPGLCLPCFCSLSAFFFLHSAPWTPAKLQFWHQSPPWMLLVSKAIAGISSTYCSTLDLYPSTFPELLYECFTSPTRTNTSQGPQSHPLQENLDKKKMRWIFWVLKYQINSIGHKSHIQRPLK